jgi:hypothetical protein
LHDSPSIVMSTFDGDIEPVAAKFWPVKVNVCGPLIDVGLTDVKYGVILCAHVYVHVPDEHIAWFVPTNILIGIIWLIYADGGTWVINWICE